MSLNYKDECTLTWADGEGCHMGNACDQVSIASMKLKSAREALQSLGRQKRRSSQQAEDLNSSRYILACGRVRIVESDLTAAKCILHRQMIRPKGNKSKLKLLKSLRSFKSLTSLRARYAISSSDLETIKEKSLSFFKRSKDVRARPNKRQELRLAGVLQHHEPYIITHPLLLELYKYFEDTCSRYKLAGPRYTITGLLKEHIKGHLDRLAYGFLIPPPPQASRILSEAKSSVAQLEHNQVEHILVENKVGRNGLIGSSTNNNTDPDFDYNQAIIITEIKGLIEDVAIKHRVYDKRDPSPYYIRAPFVKAMMDTTRKIGVKVTELLDLTGNIRRDPSVDTMG